MWKQCRGIQTVFLCVAVLGGKAVSSAHRFWQSLKPHPRLTTNSPPSPSTYPGIYFLFFSLFLLSTCSYQQQQAGIFMHEGTSSWPQEDLHVGWGEALFIVLPGVGNQNPLLPISGEKHTLTQKQSLVRFLCTSRAQCMWMIGCLELAYPEPAWPILVP